MAFRRIALLGDSEMQGSADSADYAAGGLGSMAELAADRIANLAGIGPLLGAGFRSILLSTAGFNSSEEWLQSGTGWTIVNATDAYDKAPQGLAMVNAGNITGIQKWTKPNRWGRPIVAYDMTVVDYSGGGDFQLREDGGTWTNAGQDFQTNDTVLTFRVNRPVISTVEVRAYDGSSNAGICVVGIDPLYSTAIDGIIFDNYGHDGVELSHMSASTNGDRYAIFDAEVLGTGSPNSHEPTGSVLFYVNDIKDENTTTWASYLTTAYGRLSPFGPVGFTVPFDVEIVDYDQTYQDSYRAQTITTAATLGAKVFNIDSQWNSNGWTTLAQEVAAGLLDAEQLHPSPFGNRELASRFYWFLYNEIIEIENAPSSLYPVSGKQSDVQFSGSLPDVQYTAGPLVKVA